MPFPRIPLRHLCVFAMAVVVGPAAVLLPSIHREDAKDTAGDRPT
jgi:hypothetical protein